MAIIVTEEKNRTNMLRIVGWLGILAVIGASIYYIFFAAPELVIIAPSTSLSQIAPIAQINIHPEDVLNSAAFQSLSSPIAQPTPSGPVSVGRTSPFIAP